MRIRFSSTLHSEKFHLLLISMSLYFDITVLSNDVLRVVCRVNGCHIIKAINKTNLLKFLNIYKPGETQFSF
jgi:hypothetical protein